MPNEFFDPSAPEEGDNAGAWVRSSDGTLITHSTVGNKNLLDVRPQTFASSALRIDKSFTLQAFVASASYQTLYTYSGSGLLYGFHIQPNSDKLQAQLIIDGSILFDGISVKNIFDSLGEITQSFAGNWFSAGNKERYMFSPSAPLPYSSSVTIKVKKSDNMNFDISNYIVILTKET